MERPDLYDPKINRSCAELCCHYGTLVDRARAGKPTTNRGWKADALCAGFVWRGREWSSLTQMQLAAVVWCRDVAGRHSCRPLQGASAMSVFVAVEVKSLILTGL
ncbi:hypothetical protein [Mycobacterium riyadhense]|uniref:hypothetical protein n=1 Tax=Mycobacterium riyadhense TaxID=486698 RepID=UPI003B96949E